MTTALQIQMATLLGVSYPPHYSENTCTHEPVTAVRAPCTHSQPFTPSHTQPAVFMLLPCSLVSPGTDERLLSRALRRLQVSLETCAFPLSHELSCVHTHRYTEDLHTGKSLESPHAIHTCVHSTPTQTQTWIPAGCTHSNHTPTPDTHMCACMTYYAQVSTHHSHTHANRWDLQGAWGENMSREAGTDRKLQSLASPAGAAAQFTVPTWALKGSPWAQSSHHLRQ